MSHQARDHEKGVNGREDLMCSSFPMTQNGFGDSGKLTILIGLSTNQLPRETSSEEALRKMRTANSISISPGKNIMVPGPRNWC